MSVGKVLCLFFALAVGQSEAEETMAYRFALEPVLDSPVSELPLLKEAPAPTPFIAPGDELHDLTEILRTEKKIPLEKSWVIWNQTQRLLIVHASMLDQWRVDEITGFQKQTRHAKITVNWIVSKDASSLPAETDPVFASVTLLGRSGMKFDASSQFENQSGLWAFDASTEPTIMESRIKTSLTVSWKCPDAAEFKSGTFTSSLTLKENVLQPIASWSVTGHGSPCRVTAKAEILLADGTPWRDARLRQTGDRLSVDYRSMGESDQFKFLPVPGEAKLLTGALDRDALSSLIGVPLSKGDADPFAEVSEQNPALLPSLADAVIPAALAGVVSGPLLDFREPLRKQGIALVTDNDDFAAYDPLSENLLFYSKNLFSLDKVYAVLSVFSGDCDTHPNIECSASLIDSNTPDVPLANITILSRAGTKAPFKLQGPNDSEIAYFEVEPTLGEPGNILDLRYYLLCRLQQPSKFKWHSQSMVTLANDVPLVIDATKHPDGRSLKLGLRAKVVP